MPSAARGVAADIACRGEPEMPDATSSRGPDPADEVARFWISSVGDDANAQRSDAGWVSSEIDSQAEWSFAGGSWRWHGRPIAIRRSTDGGRGETRIASARIGVLPRAPRKHVNDLIEPERELPEFHVA